MKNLIFALSIFFYSSAILAQPETSNPPKEETEINTGEPVKFERPFNFFAAAGASLRFGKTYDVTISPVDYTVQFEKVFPIVTRFSMGLVWNPIPDDSPENIALFKENSLTNKAYRASRKNLAITLLVNIFQLAFSSDQVNTTSPIDVGFGVGYRNNNFLIMGTLEFTPTRAPRKYFLDNYKDMNKQLVLSGGQEPLRTISSDDNSLFVNKIYPSIGLKIAYAFSKSKDE